MDEKFSISLFSFQVLKLESSTPFNVYVLECDESQQNVLSENDWTGEL